MNGVLLGQSLHLKDKELLPSVTDLIYADDVNAPCISLNALKGWINTLDKFYKISGLKRNNEKPDENKNGGQSLSNFRKR